MDFLGIGWGEILLILLVALLVFGPTKIIEVGRTLGKTVRAFKKAADDMTAQLDKELQEQKLEEQKKEAAKSEPVKDINNTVNAVEKPTEPTKSAWIEDHRQG